MKKLSHSEISQKRASLETLDKINKLPVVVVLNSIRSSYNVGSIFRTSDGAMIQKLYLCGYTPSPLKKEVLKTSLGSEKSVEWESIDNPVELVKELKGKGYTICSLEQTSKNIPYTKIENFNFPICLIVGNEITGVNQQLIDLFHKVLISFYSLDLIHFFLSLLQPFQLRFPKLEENPHLLSFQQS